MMVYPVCSQDGMSRKKFAVDIVFYVDNVDKTFVYANPNKNRIYVQEFEKKKFKDLLTAQDYEEEQVELGL
jgi:hypothetical protein